MLLHVSITTENYLKSIFAIAESTTDQLVGLGDIAQALGVTPGTVTTMMKSLDEAGLVEYQPRAGVSLTEEGRRQALTVIRRHRLIELFLVEVLNLDWADVHEEAEVLEHSMSDLLIDRIDEVLRHPRVDPHGDPIPNADGTIDPEYGTLLSELEPPVAFRIDRVEQDAEFLAFLKETGLVPGVVAHLTARNNAAGTLTVRKDEASVQISIPTARMIRVTVVD